jgi:NAD(P)-dependent dehydrogenase (short-subunit alcohol dehydrogenase family)
LPDTLRGKEIVLAGGSGGIGAAVTSMLAAEGARLVVGFRANSGRAFQWEKTGTVLQCDITAASDRTRLLDAAPRLYGLVVLAGEPARAEDAETIRRSWETNFLGPVMLAREAAARMRASAQPGAIVLFSTMQAGALFPGSTAYASPKAALLHAARILAKECRGKPDIRVNVVSPGVTAAGMAEASIASGKYDRYLEEGAIRRFGRPEDIARAVRFFLEQDNYVTGQVLTVDGGLTL